ncbi:hypothetical protein PVAND_010763 [Polypedilum vanderplanki]|uniref:Uncharacterized protein n=1 Tax=Polypedilum vanderplanki TaxID=319348 RepID=A0A9J6CGJ5_POLVA|nr:hypothetical protein PVAND_010763 [Polypedilum vanderplanki]
MKITVTVFAILVSVFLTIQADPVSISNNNIGDIVTIGVNLDASLSSTIDTNIVTVLLALLNQQAVIINGNDPLITPADQAEEKIITPELIAAKVKELKAKSELFETIRKMLNKA